MGVFPLKTQRQGKTMTGITKQSMESLAISMSLLKQVTKKISQVFIGVIPVQDADIK